MEGLLILLLVLAASTGVLLRFVNTAAQKSATEELRREVLREYLRRKRIDKLYGRDRDEEG